MNCGLLEVSTITPANPCTMARAPGDRWPLAGAHERAQVLEVSLVADLASPLQHAHRAGALGDALVRLAKRGRGRDEGDSSRRSDGEVGVVGDVRGRGEEDLAAGASHRLD